jgi:hypothetical protein
MPDLEPLHTPNAAPLASKLLAHNPYNAFRLRTSSALDSIASRCDSFDLFYVFSFVSHWSNWRIFMVIEPNFLLADFRL